jgi:hypothetical protein
MVTKSKPRPPSCSLYLPVDPFQLVSLHCLNGAVFSLITDDSDGEAGTPIDEHKSDRRPTGIPQTSFMDLDSMSGSRPFYAFRLCKLADDNVKIQPQSRRTDSNIPSVGLYLS